MAAVKIFDMRDHPAGAWSLSTATLTILPNLNYVFENQSEVSDFVDAGGVSIGEQSGLDLSAAKITVKFETVSAGCVGSCRYYGIGHKAIYTDDAESGYISETTYDAAQLDEVKTNYLKVVGHGGKVEIKTWEVWADITAPPEPTTSLLYATTNAVMEDIHANPNREKLIYTTQDHSNKIYVRNPNRLLPDVDLTCISPFNTRNRNKAAGTLFHPQYIWFAWHYRLYAPDTIRFVTMDNEVIERKLVWNWQYGSDLGIARLNEPVPPSITPAMVTTEYITDYLSETDIANTAVFTTDQEEKLLIKKPSVLSFAGDVRFSDSDVPEFQPFTEEMVLYDSGGPIFLVINGRVVGLSQWGSKTAGTPIYRYIDAEQGNNQYTIRGLVERDGIPLEVLDLTQFTKP